MLKKIGRGSFKAPEGSNPSNKPLPHTKKIEDLGKKILTGTQRSGEKAPIKASLIQLQELPNSLNIKKSKQEEMVKSLQEDHKRQKQVVEDLQQQLLAPDFPEAARIHYEDVLQEAKGRLATISHHLHQETVALHHLEKALQASQEKM